MQASKQCFDKQMHRRHKWWSSYKDDQRVFHICPGVKGHTKQFKKDKRDIKRTKGWGE